jgi:hypothetical protein
MKKFFTFDQPQTSMIGGYPCAIDADYGYGTGVIKPKS